MTPQITAPPHTADDNKQSIVTISSLYVILEAEQGSHQIHTIRSCESPGPPKQDRTIYRKTLTLELCEFRSYACTLGRNLEPQNMRKSVVPQGFFLSSFICNIFCVIFLNFGTVLGRTSRGVFLTFQVKTRVGTPVIKCIVCRFKSFLLSSMTFLQQYSPSMPICARFRGTHRIVANQRQASSLVI